MTAIRRPIECTGVLTGESFLPHAPPGAGPLRDHEPPAHAPCQGPAVCTRNAMGKRVLILSISAGAGHLRAAEAVEKALCALDRSLHVENYDMLEFTNKLFRQLYSKAYLDLATKAPEFLGYLYDRLDRPVKDGKDVGGDLRR